MMYRRMTEESAFNFDATLFTCALFIQGIYRALARNPMTIMCGGLTD